MNTSQDPFSNDQDDDLKNKANNDVAPDNDDIGENTEQTPLALAVSYDKESEKNSDKEKGWNNNKPGATNEDKNDMRVPTVTPENDNLTAGPKKK